MKCPCCEDEIEEERVDVDCDCSGGEEVGGMPCVLCNGRRWRTITERACGCDTGDCGKCDPYE